MCCLCEGNMMSRGLRLFITLKLESTWREESEHPALLREKSDISA